MPTEPSEVSVMYVTAPNRDQALAIARSLVHERLAACVNVVDPVVSVYRWQGKVSEDAEVLLVVKTRTKLVDRVAARVKELHSYTCPEAIALPVCGGAPAYLAWVAESTEAA